MYEKIGCRFSRKYGKSLTELSKELRVSVPTISKWDRCGFDIYSKAKSLHVFTGPKRKTLNNLWNNLKSRCGNPNDVGYKFYGERGIRLKLEKSDLVFLWERDRADLMNKPSLDRKNSKGNYELSNCRFIEHRENCRQGGLSKKHFSSKLKRR